MTYELAKQLRAAGFPFKTSEKQHANDGYERRQVILFEDLNEFFFDPTLAELVDACGQYLSCMEKIDPNGSEEEGGWMVGTLGHSGCDPNSPRATGPDLKTAIAKLWLAIQGAKTG